MLMILIATESPRQVLLFYTDSGLEKQKAQLQIFNAHQNDIDERDIKVQRLYYSESNIAEWRKRDIDTGSPPFTCILVGRDGGEKLRSSEVVSAEKLVGLIDAMPIRRREIEQSQTRRPK